MRKRPETSWSCWWRSCLLSVCCAPGAPAEPWPPRCHCWWLLWDPLSAKTKRQFVSQEINSTRKGKKLCCWHFDSFLSLKYKCMNMTFIFQFRKTQMTAYRVRESSSLSGCSSPERHSESVHKSLLWICEWCASPRTPNTCTRISKADNLPKCIEMLN